MYQLSAVLYIKSPKQRKNMKVTFIYNSLSILEKALLCLVVSIYALLLFWLQQHVVGDEYGVLGE